MACSPFGLGSLPSEHIVYHILHQSETGGIQCIKTAYEKGVQEQLKKARNNSKAVDVNYVQESLKRVKQYSKFADIELRYVDLKGIEKDAYRNSSKNGKNNCYFKNMYKNH